MNKPNETENKTAKPGTNDAQRSAYTAEKLLLKASTLSGALDCAIAGPKLPPWLGD